MWRSRRRQAVEQKHIDLVAILLWRGSLFGATPVTRPRTIVAQPQKANRYSSDEPIPGISKVGSTWLKARESPFWGRPRAGLLAPRGAPNPLRLRVGVHRGGQRLQEGRDDPCGGVLVGVRATLNQRLQHSEDPAWAADAVQDAD